MKDLKGLKMRIPGLGGDVLNRIGGTAVNLPGSELFTSLQTGVVDATEWVGPHNDLALGLYKAAQYYYYPGRHEAGMRSRRRRMRKRAIWNIRCNCMAAAFLPVISSAPNRG